jgi:hypothetical protein
MFYSSRYNLSRVVFMRVFVLQVFLRSKEAMHHTNRVTIHNVGVLLDLLTTAATRAAAARLQVSRWGTCPPSLATA